MTTAPPDAKGEKVKAAPREYTVFLKGADSDDHNPVWIEVGKAVAQTRDEALDEVVDTLDRDEQDGPFCAVASRYWQPTAPVVETRITRSWK